MSSQDGPVFMAAPPERIELPGGIAVARPSAARVGSAVKAINDSLDHLWPWMAWAEEPATEPAIAALFADANEQWDRRRDFLYSIIDLATDEVIGGTGLHPRLGPHGLEIGYWVHVEWIGRGIATAAARALTTAALDIPGIERVRIQCADDNVRSARVPAALGYRLQAVGVPDHGPCQGRLTQQWIVERADWMTSANGGGSATAS